LLLLTVRCIVQGLDAAAVAQLRALAGPARLAQLRLERAAMLG
jgi:hypothetical protein